MNKKEFMTGDIGETIGFILGSIWWSMSLPYILIKWIFTKKSFVDVSLDIFDTKIGRTIRKFDY